MFIYISTIGPTASDDSLGKTNSLRTASEETRASACANASVHRKHITWQHCSTSTGRCQSTFAFGPFQLNRNICSARLPTTLLIILDGRQTVNRWHTVPPPFCELALYQGRIPLAVHAGCAAAIPRQDMVQQRAVAEEAPHLDKKALGLRKAIQPNLRMNFSTEPKRANKTRQCKARIRVRAIHMSQYLTSDPPPLQC